MGFTLFVNLDEVSAQTIISLNFFFRSYFLQEVFPDLFFLPDCFFSLRPSFRRLIGTHSSAALFLSQCVYACECGMFTSRLLLNSQGLLCVCLCACVHTCALCLYVASVYIELYIYICFIHNNLPCAKHWTKCPTTQPSRYYYHPHFPCKKTEMQKEKVICLISLSPASGEARV